MIYPKCLKLCLNSILHLVFAEWINEWINVKLEGRSKKGVGYRDRFEDHQHRSHWGCKYVRIYSPEKVGERRNRPKTEPVEHQVYGKKYLYRQWHPTPVLLPGKSHGWRSLVGHSPWGRKESYATEWLHFSLSCIGEGNGNPLQCSCLENPRDGGAWWAAVFGVAQSRTRLKRLSSSSSRFTDC